jgi:hypothetical protein
LFRLFGGGVLWTICLSWPWTMILLISASQVARITGVSGTWSLGHIFNEYFNLCNFKVLFCKNASMISFTLPSFQLSLWDRSQLLWVKICN